MYASATDKVTSEGIDNRRRRRRRRQGLRAHRSASKPAADAGGHHPRPPGDPVIRFPGAPPALGDPVSAGDTVTHLAGDLPAATRRGGLYFRRSASNAPYTQNVI